MMPRKLHFRCDFVPHNVKPVDNVVAEPRTSASNLIECIAIVNE